MTDLNIPALKAAALAANNGQPWLTIEDLDALVSDDVAQESDCAFIALANPTTVLALIERLERAEAGAPCACRFGREGEIAQECMEHAYMRKRIERLEAVAEAASPFASSNAGGLEARLAQAIAALEAP